MSDRQELGREGERTAAAYVTAGGMSVIARNWRCRHGEIDLVAREGSTVVFIEVKTRRGQQFGGPLVAVTPQKVTRLRKLAAAWLQESGGHRGPIRIDVLGLHRHADGSFGVEHVRGVC